jgi:IMP cyclohydrolase
MYRVSSRSFPNRRAVVHELRASVVPRPGHEEDLQKNPYIAYNCLRIVLGKVAVLSNGSQTDPIAEKIALGMPVRDALALTHLAMDYEKDQYNTPRVSAVLDQRDDSAWLAVVRHDGLEVAQLVLARGSCRHIATYEENSISLSPEGTFDVDSASDACRFILSGGHFTERSHAVTSAAAFSRNGAFDIAVQDAE